MDHVPSNAEVDRIAESGDGVLRNLQITQCYHELSLALAMRTGPHANWCHFATWASRQAGQTIRKEDLARALENALKTAPSTAQEAATVALVAQPSASASDLAALQQKVWDALNPFGAIDRASTAVARGNQKVFAEIGREFARFITDCLSDPAYDAHHIERFCAALRPGDPPEGQRYLRQAFTRYYQAFFECEPKARAELMLLANIEIGLHEQTRLQPEIAAALNAALVDPRAFRRRLLGAFFPYRGWLYDAFFRLRRLLRTPAPLDIAINRLVFVAQRHIRLFLTEHMMVLGFPRGVRLRLGDDLRAEYPANLQQITSLDLRALLDQVDPTPDSLLESGAADWADLPDRLHFIVDLFRCYQEWPALCDSPFTLDQINTLKSGRLPTGPL